MPRFFDADDVQPRVTATPAARSSIDRAQAAPFDHPRGMTAAAQRLKIEGSQDERIDKRDVSKWQTQAWQMFDAIGELHYAFGMVGSVVSRVRFFPAIVTDPSMPPTKASEVLKGFNMEGLDAAQVKKAVDEAEAALRELMSSASGGQSGFLREAAINLCVPGEFYLVNDDKKWLVCSSDELQKQGDRYYIVTDRANANKANGKRELKQGAFIARIWRTHPRYSGEPDSTMLGVLDQAEKLVLFDQALRTIIRTRMNAGLVFIPDSLIAASASEEDTIESAIVNAVSATIDDETAANTVVPLVVTGPAEAGKAIQHISLARELEESLVAMADAALDRMLQGIDLPKDIVTGLADVKYANGLVITDDVYRAHIEPLVLMLVDSLTSVYLRPKLEAAGVPPQLIERIVFWYDPSAIVTRPDRSQAANEGYADYLLSGDAWRRARGFSDEDKPDPDEIIFRMALEKAQIPPDMAAQLLESIHPEFWKERRAAGQAESQMPADLSTLLSGDVPDGPTEPPVGGQLQGADISPGGMLPPSA